MNSPQPVRAVLFDMGGTLEDIYYDDESRLQATNGLREILAKHAIDPGMPVQELYALISARMKKYHQWRLETERELPPEQVWPEYIFPDCGLDRERLEQAAEELAFFYDTQFYTRTMRPEVPALLASLRERGFQLGVISNIYSRTQVPYNLQQYGIAALFEVVVLSSCFGRRKPHPSIFLEATRLLQVNPAECAYVGDTVSRDVCGARRAGYGLAIQIKSFLTTRSDTEKDIEPPDAVVEDLMQVAELVSRGAEVPQ